MCQRTASTVTVSGQTTSTDYTYEGLHLLNLSAAQSGGTNPTSWKITYLYEEEGRPYGGVYRQPGTSTTPLVFGILTTDRGDVVSLLDASGAPFAAYRYDAWGNPQGTGNVSTGVWSKSTSLISLQVASDLAERQPLRYASYYYDAESGLYYLSSRSYDPVTRQFLSKDLSRNDGEESAYQYCGGNPVAGVDPTGYRMEEFATSQERREAERVRAVTKKAQRVSRERTLWRRLNPGETQRSSTKARSVASTVASRLGILQLKSAWDAVEFEEPFATDFNVTIPVRDRRAITCGIVFNRSKEGRIEQWLPYLGAGYSSGSSISLMSGSGHILAGGYGELGANGGGFGIARGFKPGHGYWQGGPALGVPDPLRPGYSATAFFVLPQPW